MSDIIITVNGGNNQIMPNATHAEQHFHYHGVGSSPAVEPEEQDSGNEEDRQRLSLY